MLLRFLGFLEFHISVPIDDINEKAFPTTNSLLIA